MGSPHERSFLLGPTADNGHKRCWTTHTGRPSTAATHIITNIPTHMWSGLAVTSTGRAPFITLMHRFIFNLAMCRVNFKLAWWCDIEDYFGAAFFFSDKCNNHPYNSEMMKDIAKQREPNQTKIQLDYNSGRARATLVCSSAQRFQNTNITFASTRGVL